MRFSPDGLHVVMERGQNAADGARRIEVCEAGTGALVGTYPAGFNPRWLGETWIVAEAPNGRPMLDQLDAITVEYVPANRGQLEANGNGVRAFSDLSGTSVTRPGGSGFIFPNAREPRLSTSGVVAMRDADGALRISTIGYVATACEDSRWSGETLVWWLGGRVWGRTTPAQPTVELTVPGRACGHPAPLWSGFRLFVGLVLDDGELWVAEWSDLAATNGLGYRVGRSDGAGFDWDLQPNGGFVRVCYFDPLGRPVYVSLNVGAGGEQESMFLTPQEPPAPPVPPVPVPLPPKPPTPKPPKEPETMQLPNDAQMVNAMRRIHVEGYQRELQRHGGIFEAPDDTSLIFDPRSLKDNQFQVRIDDFSLAVWTGRYVAYFAQTTSGDPHEQAIRAVLRDLRNSDEARSKRGESQPGESQPVPPNGIGTLQGPIGVSGRDFEVPS